MRKFTLTVSALLLTGDDLARIDELVPPGDSIVPYIWSPWVTPDSFKRDQWR